MRSGSHRLSLTLRVTVFFNSSLFTDLCPQVVQLCATHLSIAHHLDLFNAWGVEQEGAFHAHPMGDFTNGEALAHTSVIHGNNHALEHLNSLSIALHHFCVHAHGIAWAKAGDGSAVFYGDAFELGTLLLFRILLAPSVFRFGPYLARPLDLFFLYLTNDLWS